MEKTKTDAHHKPRSKTKKEKHSKSKSSSKNQKDKSKHIKSSSSSRSKSKDKKFNLKKSKDNKKSKRKSKQKSSSRSSSSNKSSSPKRVSSKRKLKLEKRRADIKNVPKFDQPPPPPKFNAQSTQYNGNAIQDYNYYGQTQPPWSTEWPHDPKRVSTVEQVDLKWNPDPTPRIFSTQVDEYYHVPMLNEKSDEQLIWNSGLVCSICLMLSFIHYFYFVACTIFSKTSLLSNFVVPYLIWILPLSMIVFIIISLIPVIYDWGRKLPKNIFVLLVYIVCWASFWIILDELVSTTGKSTEQSLSLVIDIPSIVECVATSCLILTFYAKICSQFDLKSGIIFVIGLEILLLHLIVKIGLDYINFFGKAKLKILFLDNLFSNAIGGVIFMYICFDIQAILKGHRQIAWPNQNIFGVVAVHQDIVWIIWESLKFLLYLLPCTYCNKDGKNSIWSRWKCCNQNYSQIQS